MRTAALFVVGAALLAGAAADEPEIELLDTPLTPTSARQCFQEARQVCEEDGGRLWGISLCGPILLADPKTRAVIASHADRDGLLTPQDGVFVGKLPREETIAGTVKDWAGVTWVMLPWPLPKEKRERRLFLAHEMFHRVQGQLGLLPTEGSTNHLDTREGRTWMQLEWRALQAALEHGDPERRRAISDALTFRDYRRSLFPDAAAGERAWEIGEGLAEYTGVRLSSNSDSAAIKRTLWNLGRAKRWPTLIRSFAYVSGPAYGLLLDRAKPDWRTGLKASDDLGTLLRQALSIPLPQEVESAAAARADVYGAEELIAAEAAREAARPDRLARHRERFVTGPVLTMHIQNMQFQFDPRDVQPLDDLGKVYPKMKMADAWGILAVTGGALIANDWSSVTVPAPSDPSARPLKGDGWTLELKPGWKVRAGNRPGDYVLKHE